MKNHKIRDNGGTRGGTDRRQTESVAFKLNRRTGQDRRSGRDRRKGAGYIITIERRDVYRFSAQH